MKRLLLLSTATMLAVTGFARLVSAQTAPKPAAGSDAQPVAVMLEQGIYQEETAGNLEAAAKTYRQIVDQAAVGRSLVAQALARLAALEVRQKQLDEARQTIERLKTEYPEQKEIIAKAEALLPNNGQKSAVVGGDQSNDGQQQNEHIPTVEEKAQAVELAKQGWQQYRDGKFKPATESFERATQLDPKLIDAWNGLGWAYLNQQKPGGLGFAKALQLDPKNALALNGMGWNKWHGASEEDKEAAVKYWQRAIEADPTATSAMSGLAQSALDSNEFDDAVQWYEKWLRQDPNNADAKLGLDHAKQGQKVVHGATGAALAFLKTLEDGEFAKTRDFMKPGESIVGIFRSGDMRPARSRGDGLEEALKDWDGFLTKYRTPLGKTVDRKIDSIIYTAPWRTGGRRGARGAPISFGVNGQILYPYITLRFKTQFENKRNADEAVGLQTGDDGEWKVVSYSIEESAVPRDPLKG